MYAFLCLDVRLDGFLEHLPYPTESEVFAASRFSLLRAYMSECEQAVRQSGNSEILERTHSVVRMLGLWENYLRLPRNHGALNPGA